MKLRQRRILAAPPERIWPWVADPDLVRRWNEKLESDTAPPLPSLREGMEFWVRYRMRPGAEPFDTRAQIVRFDAPVELVVRYSGGGLGRDGCTVESVRLRPVGGGTRVDRTIEIHDPRLPWWLRIVASFLMRFGTPKGEDDLQALERVMAEEDAGRGREGSASA